METIEVATAALGESRDGFEDIPLILQIIATVIGLAICLNEAVYPTRVKVRDNKDRFEEYKKRYKWEMFNTHQMLHESEEDEKIEPKTFVNNL